MLDIDDAWSSFCDGDLTSALENNSDEQEETGERDETCESVAPKCSPLYVSTKTYIAFLNQPIDLNNVFWKIPLTPYHVQKTGIVKKQMKFNSSSPEELDEILSNIDNKSFTEQKLLSHIDKTEGRIKFNDVRKISIGICKKDITSCRCKQKNAFYNCFAAFLRIKYDGIFREIHVKVFNTGELEIPGIQADEMLSITLTLLCNILSPIVNNDLKWLPEKTYRVLINSNFVSGYYINRDKLYNILKYNYRINSTYDSCSYPGIKCAFYYNTTLKTQTGQPPPLKKDGGEYDLGGIYIKMTCMIFRTGSALIVGNCADDVLFDIYAFWKNLLEAEYPVVGTQLNIPDNKKNNKKLRKKIIIVE